MMSTDYTDNWIYKLTNYITVYDLWNQTLSETDVGETRIPVCIQMNKQEAHKSYRLPEQQYPILILPDPSIFLIFATLQYKTFNRLNWWMTELMA